jgi:hypothetical protein
MIFLAKGKITEFFSWHPFPFEGAKNAVQLLQDSCFIEVFFVDFV